MGWIIYAVVVLAVSGLIGMHLGRFREVYTEMLGMMVGMTMGMLNGFLLGYAAAAVTNSMFWGNLSGILLGLTLGVYFGRPGGLMGLMDGGMGGVMGGSMGAMLAVMVAFPRDAQLWTGVLLGGIYVMSMMSLVVLIERSAPGHSAFHRLTPFLARAISIEIAEAADNSGAEKTARYAGSLDRQSNGVAEKPRRLVNYYAVLGVPQSASADDIAEAYLERIDTADDSDRGRLERAVAVLTNSRKREAYNLKLAESQTAASSTPLTGNGKASNGRAACCPPPKQRKAETTATASAAPAAPAAPGKNGASASVSVKAPSQDVSQASGGTLPARPAGSGSAAPLQRSQHEPASAGKHGVANGGNGTGGSRNNAVAAGNYASGAPNGVARNGNYAPKQEGSRRGSKQAKRGEKPDAGSQTSGKASRKQQASYAQMQQRGASPISWVGALAAVVILLAVGWWVLSAGSAIGSRGGVGATAGGGGSPFVGASGETQAQLEQQAVVATVGTDGKQTVDVVLDSATFQYKPKAIKVKQGVPVRFNLSVENGDPG